MVSVSPGANRKEDMQVALSEMSDRHATDQWWSADLFRPADDHTTFMQGTSLVSKAANSNAALLENHPRHDTDHARRLASTQPPKLGFLPPREWDEEKDYGEEDPPRYIAYQVDWKVQVHRRKRTEKKGQLTVLSPASFWKKCLKRQIEAVEKNKKFAQNGIAVDGTDVTLSITERSESDKAWPFQGKNVKWSEIEKQLVRWFRQYPKKKIRLEVVINYEHDDDCGGASQRGGRSAKRSGTVSEQMHDDRATLIANEQRETGRQPFWPEIFAKFRCIDNGPCKSNNQGGHCWADPDTGEHVPLNQDEMMRLVELRKSGCLFETHADMPEDMRRRLRAKQPRQKDKKNMPPQITINNILPDPKENTGAEKAAVIATRTVENAHAVFADDVDLTGLAEENIDGELFAYCEWQQSLYSTDVWKGAMKRATDIALAQGLDLRQIFLDHNPDSFTREGVEPGAARRYIDFIPRWLAQRRNRAAGNLDLTVEDALFSEFNSF